MEKLDLSKVQEMNLQVAEKKTGYDVLKKTDFQNLRHTIEDDLPNFGFNLQKIRKGQIDNEKTGKKMSPRDLSLNRALYAAYGIKDLSQFLEVFELSMGDTIGDVALTFGVDNLNAKSVENMMVSHSEFANPMTTAEIDVSHRFIIPEIFTNAIRLGYEAQSQHQNWIASTTNMSTHKLSMPQILRGDGMPARVAEGAAIPMGSVSYSRKDVTIFKVGTGLKLTDELIYDSRVDHLQIFLGESGNDMAIAADNQGFLTLVNGEQADLSESAPVIGVINTSVGFQYKDVKKVFTRMKWLGQPATRIVAGEDDGVDVTGIDKFEGFQGQNKLSSLRSLIIGVPDAFDIDTYVLPANQILYLNAAKAMTKLKYRGMMTERRRNPQTQTEELYVSDHIGFAILKRDARILQDKTLDFATNGFPTYMDVATRINESYKSL